MGAKEGGSLEKFQAMPMPKRSEEDWRFATIDAIRLGKFQPGGKGPSRDAEILERSVAAFPNPVGRSLPTIGYCISREEKSSGRRG